MEYHYHLEFVVRIDDGVPLVRSEWYTTESQARIAMCKEVAMGQWDEWHMRRERHEREIPPRAHEAA